MCDGLHLKPAVTVPFCRSSVSKHLDGVYISGDVLRKKLCSAQLAITTSFNVVQLNINMSFKYTKSCYQNAENIFSYSSGMGEVVIEVLSFSCQLLHVVRLQKVLSYTERLVVNKDIWQLPSLHIR
jgi:hypothetical protein